MYSQATVSLRASCALPGTVRVKSPIPGSGEVHGTGLQYVHGKVVSPDCATATVEVEDHKRRKPRLRNSSSVKWMKMRDGGNLNLRNLKWNQKQNRKKVRRNRKKWS